jgi:hypothetical protein
MGLKFFVNERFFETWTPIMAYILGYLYADGSLEDAPYIRGKYVRVTSTDYDTVQKIRGWLSSQHSIITIEPGDLRNRKERFLLRIGNHNLYNSLHARGLRPNKSLTMKLPAVPQKYLSHFVRGYFDGDGCVHIERAAGKNGRRILKKLVIVFTSGSKRFLCALKRRLQTTALVEGKIYVGCRSFQLRYTTAESVKLFEFLYHSAPPNVFLERKWRIFGEYFTLRPQRIDGRVASVLQYQGIGHVAK